MASESMRHPSPQKSTSDALSRVSGLWQKHHVEIRHGVTAMGIGAGLRYGSEIDELLSDMSQQVLQRSAKYDPTRRFIPWVMGFVPYVLKQRARTYRQERHHERYRYGTLYRHCVASVAAGTCPGGARHSGDRQFLCLVVPFRPRGGIWRLEGGPELFCPCPEGGHRCRGY